MQFFQHFIVLPRIKHQKGLSPKEYNPITTKKFKIKCKKLLKYLQNQKTKSTFALETTPN